MILERRIPHQHPVELKHRNPVADNFGSLLGHDGPNHPAKMLQSSPRWLRRISQIFIHGLRNFPFSHNAPKNPVILSEVSAPLSGSLTHSKDLISPTQPAAHEGVPKSTWRSSKKRGTTISAPPSQKPVISSEVRR